MLRALALPSDPKRIRVHALALGVLLSLAMLRGQALAADVDLWVDPGHGAQDNGASGFDQVSPYAEKLATLAVSTRLQSTLGQFGYSSLLTRYLDEIYPTLSQRVRMANGQLSNHAGEQGTCQVFVSVHMNSSKSSTPFGTEVYYSRYRAGPKLANEYVQDQSFGDVVYSNLIQNTPAAFMGCNQNRGIHSAEFFVTKWPYVPSILVEACFISNQCQQNRIRQAGNQGLVASGIAAGISQFIFPGGVATNEQLGEISQVEPTTPWGRRGEGVPVFRTDAVQAYGESFDGASFPPAGWTVTSAGQPAPHFWSRNTDPIYVHSGAGAAVIGGASGGLVDEWLISPHLFLGPTDRGLSFYWLGNRTWAAQANAECLIRPIGTVTWTQLWSLQGEGTGQEFAYPNRTVAVSPWLGDSIQFAFHVAGTNGADFGVDDISNRGS